MEIKIFILLFRSNYFKTVNAVTKPSEYSGVLLYQIATVMQNLKKLCLLHTEIFTIL